jgi:hypothetical protein
VALVAIAFHHGFPSSRYSTYAFLSKNLLHSAKVPGSYDSPHGIVLDKFYHPLPPSLLLSLSSSSSSQPTSLLKMGISKNDDSCFDISVDPLVARIFQDEREGDDENNNNDAGSLLMESLRNIDSGILESSRGMAVWRRALAKGRSPIESDFVVIATTTTSFGGAAKSKSGVWPPPPLFSCLVEASSSLQLPRMALRHPETIPMILRSILRRTIEYARRRMDENKNDEDHSSQLFDDDDDDDDEDDDDEDDPYFYNFEDENEDGIEDVVSLFNLDLQIDDNEIARDVAEGLVDEWSEVVEGVSILDDIFGFDHDLLSSGEDEDDDGDDDGGTAGAAMGFGMRDGIWSHTGWHAIPALQKQISDIPELKDLMQELGRRPSAEEDGGDRRRFEKFAPRKPHPEGGLGAEFDPRLRRESVTGIALSGNPSEMLPSEAVLLRKRLGVDDKGKPVSNVLRRLFLAKMAESKLQSYELSGWADVPSIPRTDPLYLNRLPSAPGGPIIVCLDTSWSMSGNREALSKAVVLACVSEAHRQGRDCQVVSFSTERKVMETGVITADSDGIRRLLEFLSHSFGGGTDVTGALKFAIAALDTNNKEKLSTGRSTLTNKVSADFSMEAADILLVTDGEIPDPPVPREVMSSIERLKNLKGVKIHGLLVGKSESKPLSGLCTHTHDFLSRYTIPGAISAAGLTAQITPFNSIRQTGRMSATMLYAKKSYYDDDEGDGYTPRGRKKERGDQKWDSYDEEGDDKTDLWTDPVDEMATGEPLQADEKKDPGVGKQNVISGFPLNSISILAKLKMHRLYILQRKDYYC